ncbi:hypothetical protein SALBM135S_08767 [Streptomyces alboniger]
MTCARQGAGGAAAVACQAARGEQAGCHRRAEHAGTWGTSKPPGRNHHVMNVLDARTAAIEETGADKAGPRRVSTPRESPATARNIGGGGGDQLHCACFTATDQQAGTRHRYRHHIRHRTRQPIRTRHASVSASGTSPGCRARRAPADRPRGQRATVAIGALLPRTHRVNGEVNGSCGLPRRAGRPLPPILVHRPTMRVIDGMHRLRGAGFAQRRRPHHRAERRHRPRAPQDTLEGWREQTDGAWGRAALPGRPLSTSSTTRAELVGDISHVLLEAEEAGSLS